LKLGESMCYLRFLLLLILNIPVVALAGDNTAWPCFHGPRRDNLSTDTGLMQTWPQDGPELLWTASGIGHGYSSVAIVGGRIFTAGMIDKKTYVTALDLMGKKLWQAEGKGSLTYADGRLYCLDEKGTMSLIKATTDKWDEVGSFRLPGNFK